MRTIVTFLCFCTIVCQINILVGVQALAWFCQTKVWTPFSESLYMGDIPRRITDGSIRFSFRNEVLIVIHKLII
jgi:hypothetical protein